MRRRTTTKQKLVIASAVLKTLKFREELQEENFKKSPNDETKLSPQYIGQLVHPEEVEARSNRVGSRFYGKIYPTEPVRRAQVQNFKKSVNRKLFNASELAQIDKFDKSITK